MQLATCTHCTLPIEILEGMLIGMNEAPQILLLNVVLVLVYMSAWFLVAKSRKRIDTVDIAWGLGFVLVAWSTLIQAPSFHSQLIANIVTVWGVRLAYHIYSRHSFSKEDRRYIELSKKWKGNFWARAYISIFITQGILLLLVSMPITVAANQQLNGWGWLSYAGVIIWSAGFLIEAVADKQLSDYLRKKKRPPVMQEGLWKYSRHPNYFGELAQWWAIGIIALQVSYGWIGLIGPLTLSILIVFISGIPPIERAKRDNKEYQAYSQKTSTLIPWPPRK